MSKFEVVFEWFGWKSNLNFIDLCKYLLMQGYMWLVPVVCAVFSVTWNDWFFVGALVPLFFPLKFVKKVFEGD